VSTARIGAVAGKGEELDLSMRVGKSWVGRDERETSEVVNPATGKPIADVPVATADDAQNALEAARRRRPRVRKVLARAHDLHELAHRAGAAGRRLRPSSHSRRHCSAATQ